MFTWIDKQHFRKISIKLINKTDKTLDEVEVFYGMTKSVKWKRVKARKEKLGVILPGTKTDGEDINVRVNGKEYFGIEKFEYTMARIIVVEVVEVDGKINVLVEDKYNFKIKR